MTAFASFFIALLFATIFLFGSRLTYQPGQRGRHACGGGTLGTMLIFRQ